MTQIKLLSLLVVALLHATPASWRFGAHAEQLASSAGYSAICAIGRDENENILEWVEYHKCLGAHARRPSAEWLSGCDRPREGGGGGGGGLQSGRE